MSKRSQRKLQLVLSLVMLGVIAALSLVAAPEDQSESTVPPTVVHIRLDSIIHPVAATFVRESLAQAEEMNADAFVIELSTPGGLLTSTREIFTDMLGSEVPVVVYVSPSGAQAASAGFFILMAADIAAMAPGTNTGAAHPVSGGGEDITGAMGEKVEQDAAATIRSLATRNGRNAELAEAAVIESRSFTADEALKEGLIELIADDLPALLEAIHDRELYGEGEESSKMRTAAAEIRTLEMSTVQKILSTIAHPNIAYILMTLGGLGLYFELSNPGAILPGVIGGVCLILAFFALSVLPVNSAGIALIILAVIFFIAEVKVTSYGMLTVAGLISMVLGSMMLFKSVDPAVRVSMSLIISAALFTAAVVTFLVTMVIRTHGRQVQTGIEGLVNRSGVARTDLTPQGKVFVHGEIWNAVAEESVAAGTPVRVVAVEGMRLRVRAEA